MHLSPTPPIPPQASANASHSQTLLPPSPASPDELTPVPAKRSRRPTRTEKKTARQQWKADGVSLAARGKTAESECKSVQRRFCPSFSGAVEASMGEYRSSIGKLRGHARTARGALEAMSDAACSSGKDFKELNKRCEAAVEAYERDVQAVAERVRCEGVRLDREARELMTFAEAALEKFCRWERGTKDPNFIEGNDTSHEVIVPMVTALEMKPMTGGEERAKTLERKEDKIRAESNKAQGFRAKIAKIDRLIAADGGKTANWHVDEQAAFLKAWTRCSGDVETIVKAVREHAIHLRNRSDSEVRACELQSAELRMSISNAKNMTSFATRYAHHRWCPTLPGTLCTCRGSRTRRSSLRSGGSGKTTSVRRRWRRGSERWTRRSEWKRRSHASQRRR